MPKTFFEWMLAFVFALLYGITMLAVWGADLKPRPRCPHGYLDWDRCPVCNH